MTETKIELSGSCRFTLTTYENSGHKDVSLDYTEHSTDHWNSDTENSIDIDANKAREIVAFMHKAFPEIEQPAQPQQEPTVPATAYDRLFALNEANAARIIELEAAQAEQEPVGEVSGHDWSTGILYRDLEPGAPLYTSPPAQRKPLTDEEMEKIAAEYWLYPRKFVRAIEAAHGIKENT